jgi:hypothetical protein
MVPRYYGGDYLETGPFDPFETNRPVSFGHTKIVNFSRKRKILFLTN